MYVHFFLGLSLFGVFYFVAAVLGRGAFGFFVETFATFLAFDVSFLAFTGDVFFFFSLTFFTDTFFGVLDLGFDDCFFTFCPDERLLPRGGALGTVSFSGLAAASLKDPEAPLPLVCTNSPDATAISGTS
jgi:hypothetical protein